MLANLGLYGKVLDEIQAQIERAQKAIKKARNNPPSTNKELITRGEKLLDQVNSIIDQANVPTSDQFDKQVKKLKKSIKKLRKKAKKSAKKAAKNAGKKTSKK